MMATKEKALLTERQALSSSGLRITSQRALILDIIGRGRKHLDADEIYRQARKKDPRLSLSTVYRNLQMLKKAGVIDELRFGESRHHYEIKSAVEHHHLVCLGCGKVVEFKCRLCPEMRKDVARKEGFDITGVEVTMTGYCAKCRQGRR